MDVGDVVTTTLMVSSSSHYLTNGNIQIDGSTSNLDIDYVGGDAPDSANGSGFDILHLPFKKHHLAHQHIILLLMLIIARLQLMREQNIKH